MAWMRTSLLLGILLRSINVGRVGEWYNETYITCPVGVIGWYNDLRDQNVFSLNFYLIWCLKDPFLSMKRPPCFRQTSGVFSTHQFEIQGGMPIKLPTWYTHKLKKYTHSKHPTVGDVSTPIPPVKKKWRRGTSKPFNLLTLPATFRMMSPS